MKENVCDNVKSSGVGNYYVLQYRYESKNHVDNTNCRNVRNASAVVRGADHYQFVDGRRVAGNADQVSADRGIGADGADDAHLHIERDRVDRIGGERRLRSHKANYENEVMPDPLVCVEFLYRLCVRQHFSQSFYDDSDSHNYRTVGGVDVYNYADHIFRRHSIFRLQSENRSQSNPIGHSGGHISVHFLSGCLGRDNDV